MSLRLIQPGASVALRHPRTGALIEPLYIRKNGTAVWPVFGAAPDPENPDDPTFTGGGGQDDDSDDDEDEDEDDEPKSKKRRPASKSRRTQEDDDDDDDEEDEDKLSRPERQAARYRTRLRAEEQKNRELEQRLKALENKDKPESEVTSAELTEAKSTVDRLRTENASMRAQLAFFSVPAGIDWVDPADAFALAEREGLLADVIDEDGTVDKRELRRGLKDLAKRKPHLVKKTEDDPKARGRNSTDDDENEDEEDDEEPRSRRSAGTMNGDRRRKKAGPSREQLAKKFPVLGRI